MVEFKIDSGPWETVFAGDTSGHPIEIVKNPENFFLTIIYDEQNNKQMGALVEGYKAFVAKGAMESFIQTLPKSCIGITKNFSGKTSKIFFIAFEPIYLDFRVEDYVRKLDREIQKTYELANTINDLARASSLELKELAMSPKTDYSQILGDPFFPRMAMSGRERGSLTKIEFAQEKESTKGTNIQIGLGKTREIIKENSSDLYRTIVIGAESLGINYAMYILAENFLLEDEPIIVFDSENYFDNLGFASKNESELKEELVEFEPIGFPVKKFVAKQNTKISLADADLVLILDLLGTNDTELERQLGLISAVEKVKTPLELIEKVALSAEMNEFNKLKAERLLHIIDQEFEGLFGPAIDIAALMKKWPGGLGRTTIIDTRGLSFNEKIVFTQTIMRLISKSIKERAENNFAVFIPAVDEMLSVNEEKMTNTLLRLENVGVGLVLGAKRKPSDDLIKTMSATFSVVGKNDCAVSIKNKRNYRVLLRPALSAAKRP